MAHEFFGRSYEAGYFESSASKTPDADSSSQYPAEARENPSNKQTPSPTSLPQPPRTSPPIHDKMSSFPDRGEPPLQNEVSPELMEKITEQISERIKRELVEHFKQTGSIDEPKSTPLQRAPSNKSSSTSSPPPTARRVYTPPSPTQTPTQASTQATQASTQAPKPTNTTPFMAPTKSPHSSPVDKTSGARFSERDARPRPPGATRTYSSLELSTIDKRWGRLFDNEGNPTERLGQILRGLANHIIDEFSPKRSIVITPEKMATYYANHKLDDERHAFTSIFSSDQSNDQISLLYQDLGCQHHLVQEDVYKDPVVPALTPVGFAHWMTITIMAYPEEETTRLQKVVLATPIDADGEMIDGKPERLPKQISRHLLPPEEDRKSRKLLVRAVADFFDDLEAAPPRRRKTSITTSPSRSRDTSSSQPRTRPVEVPSAKTSPTTTNAKPIERDRMPYVGSPSIQESPIIDDAIKLERERQPYAAQPGGGRMHAESFSAKDLPSRIRANSTSRMQKDPADVSQHRTQRTQSTASQNYTPQSARSGPGLRRPSSPPLRSFSSSTPNDLHASSSYVVPPPSSASSYGPQSQSFNSPSHSSSHTSTTSFPPPPPPIDIRDKRTNQDRPHPRRATDDDARFSEFSSPRDAERWDRLQDLNRAADPDRSDRNYDTRGSSVFVDPRDPRGTIPPDPRDPRASAPMGPRDPRSTTATPHDEYYRGRETGRGGSYDDYSSRRY